MQTDPVIKNLLVIDNCWRGNNQFSSLTHTHVYFKIFFSFYLIYMNALSAYIYMFCMYAWCLWRSEVLDALKLELRMVVSCHVDAETPNPVFYMRSACSLLRSLLSSPKSSSHSRLALVLHAFCVYFGFFLFLFVVVCFLMREKEQEVRRFWGRKAYDQNTLDKKRF